MKLLLGFATILLLVSYAQLVKEPSGKIKKSAIVEAFRKANISKSILPEAPPQILEVKFKKVEVNLGNEIYPSLTTEVPKINFDYEPGALYTVIMIAIVTPPEFSYLNPVLKMLYVNVVDADLKEACEAVTYYPPNPYPGTGETPYVILAYKQECFIDAKDLYNKYQNKRYGFPFKGFVKNNTLTLCAGNWFIAEFPDDLECFCEELLC